MNWIVVKKYPLDKDLAKVTAYLRERKIEHRIFEETGMQVVAVADARMLGPLRHFLEEVERGVLVIQEEAGQAASDSMQTTSAPLQAVPLFEQIIKAPVTSLLILLSIAGAILVKIDPNDEITRWFFIRDLVSGYGDGNDLKQIWRLFTPAFLHFGVLHVTFNSLWMWDLGRRFEYLLGSWKLIIFFLITAAFSNLAQFFWSANPQFGGMSGVVFALIGFIMVSHRLRPHPLTDVPASVIVSTLIWLVICMTGAIDVMIGGGIANAAHVGGLVAGCFFGLLPLKHKIQFNR